jgi:hypothetical protein
MPSLDEPKWRSAVRSLGAGLHTTVLGAGAALVIWRYYLGHLPNPFLRFGILSLIFVVLSVAFYKLWIWVFFVHPAEIAERHPPTGKELRWKRKRFFDSFPKR